MKYIISTLLLICGSVHAETLHVNPKDNDAYSTIHQAINHANNGDTILVHPGIYTRNDSSGVVVNMLGKEIELRSTDGAKATIIQGQSGQRGIVCNQGETEDTIIDGLRIAVKVMEADFL